jgi:hypothetical protein
MKVFTSADIHDGSIFTIKDELVSCPLPWQQRGLQETATGYGKKLTTTWKINLNGRLYRIYCTCYSNNGSAWIKVRGEKIFIH